MRKRVFTVGAVAVLASTFLFLSAGPAWAQRGGGGRGGGYGGGYGGRGGYGGYGRYGGYGYGFGYGLGFGVGLGLYMPYYGYGYGGYAPYYGYGGYAPYYPAYAPGYAAGYAPDASGALPPGGQAAPQRPAPNDLAHLQLIVPENAEVLLDGAKTTQTGITREFVTPSLKQGGRYSYKITVRYPDATGKVVEDVRDIHFQANDWFSIDFTRPPPAPPTPALTPKTSKDE